MCQMKIYFIEWKYIFYRIKIFYRMKIYFYRIRIFLSNENIFLSNENNFYRILLHFGNHRGLNDEVLQWMEQEAKKLKLSEFGRCGGIILDEMSIHVTL